MPTFAAVVVDEPHGFALESGVVPELTKGQLTAVPRPVDEYAARPWSGSAENLAEQPERHAARSDQKDQQEPVEHEDGAGKVLRSAS